MHGVKTDVIAVCSRLNTNGLIEVLVQKTRKKKYKTLQITFVVASFISRLLTGAFDHLLDRYSPYRLLYYLLVSVRRICKSKQHVLIDYFPNSSYSLN